MTRVQKTVSLLIVVVALVMGLVVYQALGQRQHLDPARLLDAGIVLLPQPRHVPALSLVDQDGQPVRVDRLQGQWSLVFFGYTFCPDICPTTLAQLRQIQGMLPEETRARLRVVMVSVDPNRDTPRQLKQYLSYFDPAFRGLTGDLESVQAFSGAVGVPFVPGDTAKPNYTVDHSGNLAVIGPDGTQRGFIRAPLDNAKLAARLPALVAGD